MNSVRKLLLYLLVFSLLSPTYAEEKRTDQEELAWITENFGSISEYINRWCASTAHYARRALQYREAAESEKDALKAEIIHEKLADKKEFGYIFPEEYYDEKREHIGKVYAFVYSFPKEKGAITIQIAVEEACFLEERLLPPDVTKRIHEARQAKKDTASIQ